MASIVSCVAVADAVAFVTHTSFTIFIACVVTRESPVPSPARVTATATRTGHTVPMDTFPAISTRRVVAVCAAATRAP